MRLLPKEKIPREIWTDEKLKLPECLKEVYTEQLHEMGMLEIAVDGKTENKSIHGGVTDEETVEHFTYRFAASSGRAEYVAISPDDKMVTVSNAILSTFSQGEVSVLDIPGGAGAAMCSLLTTLAVLRREAVLPCLPVTVRIVCGDLAPKANELYGEMISRIEPFLNENSILVTFESMDWNATRNDHTAQLVDRWFDISKPTSEYVVCVSNFTGALIDGGILEEFKPCLSQILARLHDKKSTLLWIEPSSKSANKLVDKLLKYFSVAVGWFKSLGGGNEFYSANYVMINPLNGCEYSSGVTVQRFERV